MCVLLRVYFLYFGLTHSVLKNKDSKNNSIKLKFCKVNNIKMDFLKNILPTNMFDAIDRAEICTPKQIMILSIWDIQKLTGLQKIDIELLKNLVAKHTSPKIVSCNKLLEVKANQISSGCMAIDNLLNGGFRTGTLIEIYGESGSGKTQIGMQLAAKNASVGSVYICTEDIFPITRYNQIHEIICQNFGQLGNNVFVEHVYEAHELLSCIRVRLPKLLQEHKISVIIIDSVAAPFRCETTNYIQRAEELRDLALMFIKLAQEYKLAVVCMNQVTANFDGLNSKVLPSLGLAWSNMISYRLWLRKSQEASNNFLHVAKETMTVRELAVMFAPDLQNGACNFVITSKGVRDL